MSLSNRAEQQPTTKNAAPRISIGVLTSSVEDQYATSILQGIMAAAEEQDVNLKVYSGGELDSPVRDRINRNVIYDLANCSTLDALILFTAKVIGHVSVERQVEFGGQFSMPTVSLGMKLPHAHEIMFDNEYGIRIALQHLIEIHGSKRIAFIQGPDTNEEAIQRFQSYKDTLKEYGIPFDPHLVVMGEWQVVDGENAVRVLLDERKVSVDAIVGANDAMAFGALAELQRRDISVPGQVVVVGFDDVEDARAVIPSLTTVRVPLQEMGKCALELAVAMLRGETVTNVMVLKPELVVRRSCGCFPWSEASFQGDSLDSDDVAGSDTGTIQQKLMAAKAGAISSMLAEQPNTKNYRWIDVLCNAFIDDLLANVDSGPTVNFISTLDAITHELLNEQVQIDIWHVMLATMRREMAPALQGNIGLRILAEDLWYQGNSLISEAVQHAETNKQRQFRIEAQTLSAIGEPLMSVTNVTDLRQVMLDRLPHLGIVSCHIALYEDASRERAHLIFAYDQKQNGTPLELEPLSFPSRDLIPPGMMFAHRRHTLLVEALHFDNTQLGFIVLEIENTRSYVFEALRKQISSALHTTSIVQQLDDKRMLLETAMDGLKTTQAMLVHSEKMNALGQMVAGVAHEINNPIAFVTSNIHSLSKTFEDLLMGYDGLENLARGSSQQNIDAAIKTIRKQLDLDFLVDDTKDLIDQTLLGLKRVKDIVEGLRNFSRLDEAEFKDSNLRENMESTLMVASGELRNRIDVVLNIDPALTIRCAPAQLNQVFLNIIINSAQATEGKGRITIAASEDTGHVTIEFTDTGCGIAPNVIEHIFDPFFTTKPVGVGTGLGLAISHKIIVDSHHGSIAVESKPGHGTKFIIQLPKETLQ